MNRFVAPAIAAATLLTLGTIAQAAQLNGDASSYSDMAPAVGAGEIDHNLDTMGPATAEDVDEVYTPVPATLVAKPVVTPPAKLEKTVAVPTAPKEKHVPARDIPLIETQNENSNAADVTYVTGGIGDDEKQAIEESKGDYNVYVMSASTNGAFVGDSHITITRKDGEQMLKVVAGPLLYVKLPAGTYQLEATLGNLVKKQTFTIGGKKGATQNIHLSWNVPALVSE